MSKIKNALLDAEETYQDKFYEAMDNQDYEAVTAMMLGVK